MDAMTVDEFKEALPPTLKRNVNQDLIDQINTKLTDPDMMEVYRDTLIGHTSILQQGRFKLTNFVDAVKFVSLLYAGKTDKDAYHETFPDKIQRWDAQRVAKKDQASYITAYKKSKLVSLLLEQVMIPVYIANQDMFQKALATQAELMISANSEKVRSDAANSILTHLKPPEATKLQLDISPKADAGLSALRDATAALVAQQKAALLAGTMNAQEVAHSKLVINGETVEEDQ